MASEKPAPQIVGRRLIELQALENPSCQEPVHFEFDLMLNPAQREVYHAVLYYTQTNPALRTYLIGLFMSSGASTALNELRKSYPRSIIEMSAINMGMFGRQL